MNLDQSYGHTVFGIVKKGSMFTDVPQCHMHAKKELAGPADPPLLSRTQVLLPFLLDTCSIVENSVT